MSSHASAYGISIATSKHTYTVHACNTRDYFDMNFLHGGTFYY